MIRFATWLGLGLIFFQAWPMPDNELVLLTLSALTVLGMLDLCELVLWLFRRRGRRPW